MFLDEFLIKIVFHQHIYYQYQLKKVINLLVGVQHKMAKDNLILKSLEIEFPSVIKVSAKEKTGFLELAETINEKLLGPVKTFKLPLDRSDLVSLIRKTGVLYKEEWLEDHILVEGRLGGVIESSQRTLRLVEEARL